VSREGARLEQVQKIAPCLPAAWADGDLVEEVAVLLRRPVEGEQAIQLLRGEREMFEPFALLIGHLSILGAERAKYETPSRKKVGPESFLWPGIIGPGI
jgi:hypothetical protein